jgi:hypothetical protein
VSQLYGPPRPVTGTGFSFLFLTPEDGQVGRNMQCPIKEYEKGIVNDVAHRRHESSEVRFIQCSRMLKYNNMFSSMSKPT